MTLRLQFDDLVRKMEDSLLIDGGEEEFIETIVSSIALKERYEKRKEELHNLKKILIKKKKEVGGLKSKLKTESKKLKEEKEKTLKMEDERDALDAVLEETRNVVLGHNSTKAELLSLLESANSLSVNSS